jgi:hypothetical protein
MIFSENRKSTLGSSPRAGFFRIMLYRPPLTATRRGGGFGAGGLIMALTFGI